MNYSPNHSLGMGDIRNTLMTMMMVKNVNGSPTSKNQGTSDIYNMIYMMIVTSFIDLVIRYLPIFISVLQEKYKTKINDKITGMTTDIFDNTVKTKSGSVIMEIVVNDAANVTSQAILDYITNHKNTIFVSYKKQTFLLNQKDVIALEDDYYACMQEHSGLESTGSTNSETQRIEIYSFIHNTTQIRKFIEKVTYNYSITMKNKLGSQRYLFNMNTVETPFTMESTSVGGFVKSKNFAKLPPNLEFMMKPFQTNRSFGNLFGEKIDIIRERVNFFINNKRWYDEKGIPYTLGILLSGPPGTGKTSTIKCIANETNRHIFNINFNSDITKKQLENLFFNENVLISSQGQNGKNVSGQVCIPLEQRIYVLEDIDCQCNLVLDRSIQRDQDEQEIKNSSEAIDLSFLLNLLDGVLENPGRIVIMTSNYPEKLDRALVRPGRIDIISKFDYCSHKTMLDMIEFFYDRKLTQTEKSDIMSINEYSITPAELSRILFENLTNYQNMYKQLEERFKVETNDAEGITLLQLSNNYKKIPIVLETEIIKDETYNIKSTDIQLNDIIPETENHENDIPENEIIKDLIVVDSNEPVNTNHISTDYSVSNYKDLLEKALNDREENIIKHNRYGFTKEAVEMSNKYKEIAKNNHYVETLGDFGRFLNQDLDGIRTIHQDVGAGL
jgi:ATP-dependent 26S proteasome regulatory subunit